MDNGLGEKLLTSQVDKKDDDLKVKVYNESKKIWRVAFPGILSRVASFGSIVVTQSFIGHIGELDLAGYALVQTLLVRFVNGILIGMSSATETLCGQAYGARQYYMMGIYLQRSCVVELITMTILLPFFIFATPILRLLGEQEDIARSAGYIALWFIPIGYSFVFAISIQMYLQAQQKNTIVAWLSTSQFVIHVPLSWLLVYKFEFGVTGAMFALCVSSWFVVIGELVYLLGGWCPATWRGFTIAAFKDILPVVKLSIASGIMLCLELWYSAVLVLLAGYMKNAEVAISAFSVCLNINSWIFMITLGFVGAACVRIANELGRGDAKAAKFSIKVLVGTSVVIGVFFSIIDLAFSNKIGYLFSDEKEVAEAVADLSLLTSTSILLNSFYAVLSGVAIGAGLQSTVAVINLCCFYLIGIPVGALLGYVAHLEVKGIWTGMICGVVSVSVALLYMTWRTNWDNEVAKAKQRLDKFYLKIEENSNQPPQLA
ncbi:unnamed protein product [Cuscuta epithymum]|uniref:Protein DETOXIFICATION n=1 Tax=Cuscuta epithymum TaxID=186058 RepID=A0AAV0F7Z1_9ASTE|nr:unnamed protein product [Cuscuta epithymum]CAH9131659.1 unnamed protein product [Cuscuta epithymum]